MSGLLLQRGVWVLWGKKGRGELRKNSKQDGLFSLNLCLAPQLGVEGSNKGPCTEPVPS